MIFFFFFWDTIFLLEMQFSGFKGMILLHRLLSYKWLGCLSLKGYSVILASSFMTQICTNFSWLQYGIYELCMSITVFYWIIGYHNLSDEYCHFIVNNFRAFFCWCKCSMWSSGIASKEVESPLTERFA